MFKATPLNAAVTLSLRYLNDCLSPIHIASLCMPLALKLFNAHLSRVGEYMTATDGDLQSTRVRL